MEAPIKKITLMIKKKYSRFNKWVTQDLSGFEP